MKTRGWTPLVLLAALTSGCGTVCNLGGGFVHPDSEPKIYGGVQRDFEFYSSSVAGGGGPRLQQGQNGTVAAFYLGLFCLEPALSLVGDTFTLPVTVSLQLCRENAEEQARRNRLAEEQTAAPTAPSPQPEEMGSSVVPSGQ